jgi:hypothetical protein
MELFSRKMKFAQNILMDISSKRDSIKGLPKNANVEISVMQQHKSFLGFKKLAHFSV